jgi:hypothetical protein
MTTIEVPIPVVQWIDDEEVDEFVAHLYWTGPVVFDSSLCGVPRKEDPHCQMHEGVRWDRRDTCPTCGAKVCPACMAAGGGEK